MNSSFGAEDGLQQLQTVVDGSRYGSASICDASQAYSDLRSAANYGTMNMIQYGTMNMIREHTFAPA